MIHSRVSPVESKTILVLEDEQAVRKMLRTALERSGFDVCDAPDTLQARQCLRSCKIDAALIDWMLPGESGASFLRWLRRQPEGERMPAILVTARGSEQDKLEGFDLGADDYVTKPFSPAELVARIQALLRRSAPSTEASQTLVVEPLVLDPEAHELRAYGRTVRIGPTEFRLLRVLMERPGRVLNRAQLLDKAWGQEADVEERTVDVHIMRLRKALAPYGCDALVETVRGVGYRVVRGH